jgi:hypothetical protein
VALTSEQSRLFDQYERLFAEPGWKDLLGDLKAKQEALLPQLLKQSSNEKDLWVAKGMNFIINYLLNLESTMDSAKAYATDTPQETEQILPEVYN